MSSTSTHLSDQLRDYLQQYGTHLSPLEKNLQLETRLLEKFDYQISPEQAGLLQLLVVLLKPRLALEVGVFTGLSSLVVAKHLQTDGLLYCCDVSAEYTHTAKEYWLAAGVLEKVRLTLQDGVAYMTSLLADGYAGRFDYIFLDANKDAYEEYYAMALQLLREGGMLVIDNVFRQGRVADANSHDPGTIAVKKVNRMVSQGRYPFVMLPVGDGVTILLKREGGRFDSVV